MKQMKIEELRIDLIESEPITPEWRPIRNMMEYPGAYRARFGHRPFDGEPVRLSPRPAYGAVLRLSTDANIETSALLSVSWGKEHVEWEAQTFKTQWNGELVGENALDRERMWHKLWMARRYFHVTSTAPLELIDELLWDLAGMQAGLPVHKLIGGFRDRIPAYQVVTSLSYEENLAAAAKAKQEGFFGFKDHMMLGVDTNLSLARDLRDLVGDDFQLMHDPVQQYTVEDAVKVGRALEDLGYLWIEEPLQEVDVRGLKRLADELDLPVLALESIQGHPYLVTPYLVAGAVDIVRQRGFGITGQLKLANLCDMFGVGCHGGNPHVVAAVRNDDWWEHSGSPLSPPPSHQTAFAPLFRDTTRIEDGYMYPPTSPGLGRDVDLAGIADRTIATV